ncbi:pyridoxamine 5'-phosphate oxidase [Thioalkalivibrio sp. HK1]|uniref:pyridoxamine 5'-phosphate oxidase n=1 Tax=Thioalkalivibrio sp. HK1 TaxID=1469245 RepID=UPI00046F2E76|nr:pyridoxamine 5'-phosphate oxidase [Thioalkalivibrio sp. HK1]
MTLFRDALERFGDRYRRAADCSLNEPSAMTLSTVDADGCPSARVVLLKGFDERGFVFYTNTLSRKGRALSADPRAALCFFWDPLMEQVRIEGTVDTVSDATADAYWQSRHPDSRIGAWASKQSEPLESRRALEDRIEAFATRFEEEGDIPRPAHWSGYRLLPDRIEFWRSLPNRLHERVLYRRDATAPGGWSMGLLNP